MSKLNVPLLDRYERQKVAIKKLEDDLSEAVNVAGIAVEERRRAFQVLDDIGDGKGKYSKLARERVRELRERSPLREEAKGSA